MFTVVDPKEHVRQRSMWLGSNKLMDQPVPVCREGLRLQLEKTTHTPMIYSCFDEILVNAIDQHTRFPKRVTEIVVGFDSATRRVTVRNDGPGIPLKDDDPTSLQQLCCQIFSGSNFDDSNRYTGGSNGCGIKLVNFNSREFSIKTVTNFNKKPVLFSQTFFEGSDKVNEAVIEQTKAEPFTEVSYILELDDGVDYSPLFLARTVLAAGWFSGTGVAVYFEGQKFLYASWSEFVAQHIAGEPQLLAQAHHDHYVMQLFLQPQAQLATLGWVNGIFVPQGDHVNQAYSKLLEAVADKGQRQYKIEVTKALLKKNTVLIVRCLVNNPQFNSQSKTSLQLPRETASSFAPKSLKLETGVVDLLLQNIARAGLQLKAKRAVVLSKQIDKYQRALKCGTKESAKCTLFIAEGDSAMSMLKEGIKNCLSNDYYGVFSLQGVIVNSRKQVQFRKGIIAQSTMLKDNKALGNLERILGLQRGIHYDPESVSQLPYGSITVVVDQDTDGVGNIFGLLLSHLHLFWPELFSCGYVYRLNTPIIRAFRGKRYDNFYSKEEYLRWAEQNPKHEVKYYKGLAGHYGEFVTDIFRRFRENKIAYRLDSDADCAFETFFGKDPNLRKTELSTPLVYRDLYTGMEPNVTCTEHLKVETKQYQLENIERKIPHVIDGLMITRRKVLFGSMQCWNNDNRELKVFQLSGEVAKRTYYHHGDGPLQDTIICMAQNFYGARRFPYLNALGQFGTRHYGGKDAGQPRYISVSLNKKLVQLLYPPEDLPNLDYRTEDGIEVEPEFFAPVIPTILIEDYELPATGWKVCMYARDVFHVTSVALSMVQGEALEWEEGQDLAPSRDDNYFREMDGEYSIGDYKYHGVKKGNMLVEVTELPLGMWTETLLNNLKTKDFVYDYADKSGSDKVSVLIYLTLKEQDFGSFGTRKLDDPIIQKLGLYRKLNHYINCVAPDRSVLSFQKYHQVLPFWFAERKRLYRKRLERMIADLKRKSQRSSNQLRFITDHIELWQKLPRDQLVHSLAENGYHDVGDDFAHIANLRVRDTSTENVLALKTEVADLERQLAELTERSEDFPGQKIWIDDILSLQKHIDTL